MVLETVEPREQSGRDSFARYRAQVRSAAIEALKILSGTDTDRVYCDLHDDIVVRKKDVNGLTYVFYQVKTRAKQNQNWTLTEVFGLKTGKKPQVIDEVRNSFVGKMLLHTVIFDEYCNAVVFQTNIHNHDQIDQLLDDIESGNFANKFSKYLVASFNELFSDKLERHLLDSEIKTKLSKIRFENDVHYLKQESSNFFPEVRERIHQYSEIDLQHHESIDIVTRLLDLISNKSAGVVKPFTVESIEKSSAISIYDILPLLSISKEAYEQIVRGEDPKAIKSTSIIQRTLVAAGASLEDVTFCSKCKTEWDVWYRNNRHSIPEMDLRAIICKVQEVLQSTKSGGGKSLLVSHLRKPLSELLDALKAESLSFDLTKELLLGAVFSELVKGGI